MEPFDKMLHVVIPLFSVCINSFADIRPRIKQVESVWPYSLGRNPAYPISQILESFRTSPPWTLVSQVSEGTEATGTIGIIRHFDVGCCRWVMEDDLRNDDSTDDKTVLLHAQPFQQIYSTLIEFASMPCDPCCLQHGGLGPPFPFTRSAGSVGQLKHSQVFEAAKKPKKQSFWREYTAIFEVSTLIAVNGVIIAFLPWQLFRKRNGGGCMPKSETSNMKNGTFKSQTSRQCSLNDTLAKWATVRQISVTKVQITSATQCMRDTDFVASLWSHHFQRYLYLNKSFLCLSISAHVSTGLSWSFRVFASPSAWSYCMSWE